MAELNTNLCQTFKNLSGYARLLTYADPSLQDVGLLIVGTVTAIASGVPFPLLGILFGQLMDDLNSATCNDSDARSSSVQPDVNSKVLTVVYIGIANLVLIYLYIVSWNLYGERLAQRIRERYLRRLLYKDVSFFDKLSPGEVSSHLNADIATIQQGTSEKVGIVLNAISFFVAAYTIAFIKDAELGGMLVSLTPAFLLMSLVGGYFVGKYSGTMSSNVSSASSIALEALSNIIIVHAFGANSRLEGRFADILKSARSAGIRKAVAISVQSGLLYFIAYSSNALAYWQGSKQIARAVGLGSSGTTVGTIYTVIFILVDATIILSTVAPFLQIFGAARSAFEKLDKNIQHESSLVRPARQYQTLEQFSPRIDLENVSFTYPSRLDTPVLRDVSLHFPVNKHSAIVGLSGSGKSTIANLIMRLYDPSEGRILLGEHSLQSLKPDFLRSCMSLVQQEPSHFDRSILENIALGLVNSRKYLHLQPLLQTGMLADVANSIREGSNMLQAAREYGKEAAEIVELVQDAAVLADADIFVRKLRNGYGTLVGSKGTLISGGQKQRISLARALVKNPDILLLDEATASLDSASERRIQAAINRASSGRTTITIAHRLSTIRDADNIIVMKAGEVVEQGTHTALIKVNGLYADLLKLQNNENETATQRSGTSSVSSTSTVHLQGLAETGFPAPKDDSKIEQPTLEDEPGAKASKKTDPEIDTKRSSTSIFRTLAPLFRPSLLILLIAFVAVIIVGGTYSASATIFGNTVGALSPCNPAPNIRSAGEFFALMFFVLAIIEFFANIVSWSGFGIVAEKVLHQVRVLSFRSLIEQELNWHESAERTPSSLLGLITSDVNAIGGLTGSTVGTVLSILVNLVAAIVLTHVLAWKIALVCLAVVPLILGAGTMQLIILARFTARHQEAFTRSVGIAVEAIESIRTITVFCLEDEVLQTYLRSLKSPIRETTQRSLYANMWLALAYGIPTFIYALAYWWGTKLVVAGDYSQVQFFIVLIALLVSAQLWGQLFTIAPDVSKAFTAVQRVVNVISLGSTSCRTTDIEQSANLFEKSIIPSTHGASVTFSNVAFSYPARPTIQVLRSLSLSITPGQFAAFVGPSGAGKSTIIALIERMYRPNAGSIRIDGLDIATAPSTFRDQIAFVPQDSVLFGGSIRFNVSLGATPTQTVSDAEIEDACRIANIHETIVSFPDGYNTEVGTGGTQFSGGQKQRLAIARALVRKPRLVLLDESTSALDAESEKLFKAGLEEARRKTGMTVIAIAHSLSTISKADVIFYLDDGEVVEHGRHEDLMESCDAYRMNAVYQGF